MFINCLAFTVPWCHPINSEDQAAWMGEETEVQRWSKTCPEPHSQGADKLGLRLRSGWAMNSVSSHHLPSNSYLLGRLRDPHGGSGI